MGCHPSAFVFSSSFTLGKPELSRRPQTHRLPCPATGSRQTRVKVIALNDPLTEAPGPERPKQNIVRRVATLAAAGAISFLLPMNAFAGTTVQRRHFAAQVATVSVTDSDTSSTNMYHRKSVDALKANPMSSVDMRKVHVSIVPRRTDPPIHKALKCALIMGIATTAITAITIAVFWVIQDTLVYKPTGVWRGTPKSWDMPHYEDVRFQTPDGVDITGWFIKQPPGTFEKARTLIYFHGTDKNASFRLKKVVGFYEQCRCNILLLSYRGYGMSTGKPNEKGVRIDAESALNYLKSRGDVDVSPGGKLWVFGESLGGAVAIHFTRVFEKHVNALILENTFTSLLDMIRLEFPILGIFRYLSRNKWQSNKWIKGLELPILFLSGAKDAYIPPRMMRQMYDFAENARVREFVEFEHGTHNRTWTTEGFYDAIAEFMKRVESNVAPPALVKSSNEESAILNNGQDMITAAA